MGEGDKYIHVHQLVERGKYQLMRGWTGREVLINMEWELGEMCQLIMGWGLNKKWEEYPLKWFGGPSTKCGRGYQVMRNGSSIYIKKGERLD